MDLKIKKLKPSAILPSYSRTGDAGMDIIATSETSSAGYIEYGTDLAFQIPRGYAGLIFPRSSISKTDQYLRNSVGVIDSGYRGEVKIRMSVPTLGMEKYKVGDRVAQLILIKLPWVDIEEVSELDDSDRGSGGFGSTGN